MEICCPVKIMLIEDSALDRRQIGRFLRSWSLEYVAVENGADAWSLLQGRMLRAWFFSIGCSQDSMALSFVEE